MDLIWHRPLFLCENNGTGKSYAVRNRQRSGRHPSTHSRQPLVPQWRSSGKPKPTVFSRQAAGTTTELTRMNIPIQLLSITNRSTATMDPPQSFTHAPKLKRSQYLSSMTTSSKPPADDVVSESEGDQNKLSKKPHCHLIEWTGTLHYEHHRKKAHRSSGSDFVQLERPSATNAKTAENDRNNIGQVTQTRSSWRATPSNSKTYLKSSISGNSLNSKGERVIFHPCTTQVDGIVPRELERLSTISSSNKSSGSLSSNDSNSSACPVKVLSGGGKVIRGNYIGSQQRRGISPHRGMSPHRQGTKKRPTDLDSNGRHYSEWNLRASSASLKYYYPNPFSRNTSINCGSDDCSSCSNSSVEELLNRVHIGYRSVPAFTGGKTAASLVGPSSPSTNFFQQVLGPVDGPQNDMNKAHRNE